MTVIAEIYGIMYIFVRGCLEKFFQNDFVKSFVKPTGVTLKQVFSFEFWEIVNEEHLFQKTPLDNYFWVVMVTRVTLT